MQTVNFQCSHCHKVMAVSHAYLGKQVRCPHCQQVVTAPAQAPAVLPTPPIRPTPPASVSPPGRGGDEPDSIFGEHIDEDLFGGPPKSKVELPPQPPRPAPNLQLEPTVFQMPGVGSSAGPMVSNSSPAMAPTQPHISTPEIMDPAPETTANAAPGSITRPLLRPVGGSVVMTSLVLILIPYSILITVIALILYFNQQKHSHPLEMLPDLGNPPSKRVGGPALPVLSLRSYTRIKADTPLPPNLIVGLGQTLRVGDLEVTPLSVEQKRVLFKYRSGQYKPELSEHEALVLHLQLKNVSKDVEFRPTDVAFDHVWKDGVHPLATMPYTYLEPFAGSKRYCGPLKWNPAQNKNLPGHAAGSDEFVEGQEHDDRVLQPGESIKTMILTDPAERVPDVLRNYNGKMLWRIQLRRGIEHYKDRDFSVTAVIGVEFSKADIVKK